MDFGRSQTQLETPKSRGLGSYVHLEEFPLGHFRYQTSQRPWPLPRRRTPHATLPTLSHRFP